MNNVNIEDIEKERLGKLKQHGLDQDSIKIFKSKIAKVSKEKSTLLGKEMFEMIAKRGFNDDYEKVIEYIHKGADIEYKNDTKGDFALLICARKGYFKTFVALLKAGANIDQVNNFLTTATMAAARHGHKNMLELLILMGADINAQCKDGDNALISAKRHDQIDCFNMLVEHNARVFHKNLMQESVFEIKSSKSFDLTRFTRTVKVTPKIGATKEEADNLINEAEEALKKVLK